MGLGVAVIPWFGGATPAPGRWGEVAPDGSGAGNFCAPSRKAVDLRFRRRTQKASCSRTNPKEIREMNQKVPTDRLTNQGGGAGWCELSTAGLSLGEAKRLGNGLGRPMLSLIGA